MITAGNNLTDLILRQLSSICGTDEVQTDPDLPLFEREVLDSLKTVELIVAIEQETGIYVSPAELDRKMWATPGKIIADIRRRLRS